MKILETDEYHEDFGSVLFFHFETFEEPPAVYCGSPLETDFDADYWNYFTKDFDFNSAISQAEKLDNESVQEFMGN